MTDNARKPAAFRLQPDAARPAPKPQTRPEPEADRPKAGKTTGKRRPRAMKAPEVLIEDTPPEQPLVPARQPGPAVARTIRWASLLLTSLAALATMWAGLTLTRLIEDLFARSEILGWIGSGVLGLAVFALTVIIGRELVGLLRLRKLEHIQRDAAAVHTGNERNSAARVLTALRNLYRGRPDTAWGLSRLHDTMNDVMDPVDRLRLAERDLMAGLDEQAGRIIARAGRRVALVTAVTPVAALDILLVAMQNLQMLRAIATHYGGRPGTLGTFKLARMVIGHLAVTGGLALSDNLIQQVIGKGIIGRLSSRFGEGAVNGILTARIGLAALDLCRPIPFVTRDKPALSDFLREIVNFDNDGTQKGT
jgi:putative membrane protein